VYEGLWENGYDTRDALVKNNHEEERRTNKSRGDGKTKTLA
jgi:hypothetical protein